MSQTKYTKDFIKNLEIWRVKNDISQAEFSKRIGISKSSYCKLVNGEISKLSIDTLMSIYKHTGKLCFQFMEYYDDDYLKTIDMISRLPKHDMRFMKQFVEIYLKTKGELDAD